MTGAIDFGTLKRIREANAAEDASKWTPRDVLVETIRQIDAGEITPEVLAVSWLERDGAAVLDRHNISVSSGDVLNSRAQAVYLAEALRRSVWEED